MDLPVWQALHEELAASGFVVITVAMDSGGAILIADGGNSVLRRVLPSGCTQLVAGVPSNPAEMPGRDGPAASATLVGPRAVYPGAGGTIYFVDDNRLRLYSP